jgi:beta-glucosidase/6-phospho-beta-glucosidase/beta-galactosidase
MVKQKLKFPENFLWGISTSAFQIEGSLNNDMTEWEALGMFNNDGDSPKYENAVEHWKYWNEDFDLLHQIGVNAYRFSVEWA